MGLWFLMRQPADNATAMGQYSEHDYVAKPRREGACRSDFRRRSDVCANVSSTTSCDPYGATTRQVMPRLDHRSHKEPNNRAEISFLPFRKRERTRHGFRSIRSLQRVSIFSAARNYVVPTNSNRSAFQITLICRMSNCSRLKPAST